MTHDFFLRLLLASLSKSYAMRSPLFFLSLFFSMITMAQSPVGIFSNHADIGKPKISGSAVFNVADQSYTLKAGGYNIWFGRDEFHFAYNKIKGDFILTANFKLVGKGTDPHRKIGWMVRPNLEPGGSAI